MSAKPSSLQSEPFRLFFPLAAVLGVVGVSPWLLFATGLSGRYLSRFHAVTQTQAFLPAFAAGFLMTAVPKRTGTRPAGVIEIGALLVLVPSVSLATLFEANVLGQLAYAASLLLLARFAIVRFVAREAGRRPPASFVMVPVGLLAGLAGAACSAIGLGLDVPGWVLDLGRRLAFEGVFLCLALGVGTFFLPLAGRGEGAPDLDRGRRSAAPLYLLAGLSILAGLAVEVAGWSRVGLVIRGAVAAAVLLASGALRVPTRPGANRKLVWAAAWLVPAGFLAAAAFPDRRIEALHLTFVGGFGLLAFAVGAHVTLGHTGHDAAQAGRPWPVVVSGALLLAAAGLRASALAVPALYFGWLGAAAAAWLAGAIVWALFILPKLAGRAEEQRP